MIGGIFNALVNLVMTDPMKVIHVAHLAHRAFEENYKDENNEGAGNKKDNDKKVWTEPLKRPE